MLDAKKSLVTLVLSPKAYHEISSTAIVAPITSNMGEWSFKVFLDDESPIKGAILVDQIKSLDRANRGFKKIATAPRQIVEKVDNILQQLLQLD